MAGRKLSIRWVGALGIVLIVLGAAVWVLFGLDDGSGLNGQGSLTTSSAAGTSGQGTGSSSTTTEPDQTTDGGTSTSESVSTTTGTTSTPTTAASQLVVRVPAGVATAGDLAAASFDQATEPGSTLLAILAYHSNEQVSVPDGWSLMVHGDGSAVDVQIFQRIATGEEGTVSFGFGSPTRWVLQLIELQGTGPASGFIGASSDSTEVTSLGTGTLPASPTETGLAIAAITYNVDVAVSGWTEGFATVATLGAGRANNQMHLDVALKDLAGSGDVASEATWSTPGRAATVLVVFPTGG